jgi:hypothetical protein
MYKFSDNQISFTDFNMPNGLELNSENRWVKKADLIPWREIEKRYAGLFKSENGNPAKPLRLAPGAVLIYTEYAYFSDEETVLQIQENPYLQYFCGLPGYTDERPFDPSLMGNRQVTAHTFHGKRLSTFAPFGASVNTLVK